MAIPSRAYVGLLVFGVMATLLVGGYTALVLSGYTPAENSAGPPQFFQPPQEGYPVGHRLLLVVATIACVLLTAVAWRQLLDRARSDAAIRKSQREERPPRPAPTSRSRMPPPPPGYE